MPSRSLSARHALFEAVARVFMCDDGLCNRAHCAYILLLKAISNEDLRNFAALMQVVSEELTEIGLHGAGERIAFHSCHLRARMHLGFTIFIACISDCA
ncbi:hypothetical protein XALC_1023 [Xanthomonas albilineans GPE PC73]|uniref:Uncharacterized protein n=1 Tax=Xanthomonas albilineans (strain GPE PC73 / CFBP 7063) TaxID=380358 RepID=D2UD48_XANAP|nr:hypothetical protein XALC_1023 [Xanthomonas albilineans GPE PC73]